MRTNTAVIFDLDDTLIDTQKRHFNIVKDFLKEVGKSLDFEEYLNIRKKNNWPNSGIIKKVCPLKVDDFSSFWRLNIENMKYLKHDIEIVDTALLNELKTKRPCDFILLSLRSNPASAEEQFKQFSFSSLFEEYHFLSHAELSPKLEKLKSYKKLYQHIIFVSDSQADCKAAELAGVDFAGVRSGMYHLSCKSHFDNINSFLLKQIKYGY